MAAVHAAVLHAANAQSDRGALVEERQEAAIVGRRSQNSERVRAQVTERRFRPQPDSQRDQDVTSGSRGAVLEA
jgi:hypothetical protein